MEWASAWVLTGPGPTRRRGLGREPPKARLLGRLGGLIIRVFGINQVPRRDAHRDWFEALLHRLRGPVRLKGIQLGGGVSADAGAERHQGRSSARTAPPKPPPPTGGGDADQIR